jgi:pilus assembly protein CpaF
MAATTPEETHDEAAELAGLRDELRAELLRYAASQSNGPAAGLRASLECRLDEALSDGRCAALTEAQTRALREELLSLLFGFGPLESLLADESVTEIMVNAPDAVYVERDGVICDAGVRLASSADLQLVIDRLVSRVGKQVNELNPYVDGRLPDGSRFNVIIPPVALDGPVLTIRKFHPATFSLEELIRRGMLDESAGRVLTEIVEQRRNLLVSGRTSSGKTCLLNALSRLICPRERILTIEDAAELRLGQPHVVRLEARTWHTARDATVTIRDLVRNALRMRPDRLIVGECRGPEALDMLQAMNTGHDGCMTTVHANSAADALARIETMALMAGVDLPPRAVRQQIARALDFVVHLERQPAGERRLDHIVAVEDYQDDGYVLREVTATA